MCCKKEYKDFLSRSIKGTLHWTTTQITRKNYHINMLCITAFLFFIVSRRYTTELEPGTMRWTENYKVKCIFLLDFTHSQCHSPWNTGVSHFIQAWGGAYFPGIVIKFEFIQKKNIKAKRLITLSKHFFFSIIQCCGKLFEICNEEMVWENSTSFQSVHMSICPYVNIMFIRQSVNPSICPSVNLFIYLSTSVNVELSPRVETSS